MERRFIVFAIPSRNEEFSALMIREQPVIVFSDADPDREMSGQMLQVFAVEYSGFKAVHGKKVVRNVTK